MTQPDSLQLLRGACEETSQAEVARKLGYSPSAINQVLKGTYPDPQKILSLVEQVYSQSATINCPIVGPITPGKCVEHRNRPFAATNPTRVALFRRCPACGGKP